MEDEANGVKVLGDIWICARQTDANSPSLITFDVKTLDRIFKLKTFFQKHGLKYHEHY